MGCHGSLACDGPVQPFLSGKLGSGKAGRAQSSGMALGNDASDESPTRPKGESVGHEARKVAPAVSKTATGQVPSTREELSRMTVRELKDLLRVSGGDPTLYIERSELLEAAWDAVGRQEAVRPAKPTATSTSTATVTPIFMSPSIGLGQPEQPPAGQLPPVPQLDPPCPDNEQSSSVPDSALDASLDEAAEAVLHHCEASVATAASRLEQAWGALLPEVAKAEFQPALIAAVRSRNVFNLIDAALELKRAGTPVVPKVQHLCFEVSMAEEAWLVRKSILDAARRGDANDIELWADQAKSAGEDISVELAYVNMLRWTSSDERPLEGRQSSKVLTPPASGEEREEPCQVGGDEGMRPLRSSGPGRFGSKEPPPLPVLPELRPRGASARGAGEDHHAGASREQPRSQSAARTNSRGSAGYSEPAWGGAAACEIREAAPYSAAAGDLGRHRREALSSAVPDGKSRYEGFWQQGKEPGGPTWEPKGAGSYSYGAGALSREQVAQAPRYANFWTKTEAAQDDTSPKSGTTGYSPSPGAAGYTPPTKGPPQPTAGTVPGSVFEQSPGAGAPPRPPKPPRPSSANSAPPQPPPPPSGQGGASVGETAPTRTPSTKSARPSSAGAGYGRPSAYPGGHRVRLLDFLQARSTEPNFAKATRPRPPQPPEHPPTGQASRPSGEPRGSGQPSQGIPSAAPRRRTWTEVPAEDAGGDSWFSWGRGKDTPSSSSNSRPSEGARARSAGGRPSDADEAGRNKGWWKDPTSGYRQSRDRAREQWEREKEARAEEQERERREKAFWEEQAQQQRKSQQRKAKEEAPPPQPPPPPPPPPPRSGGGGGGGDRPPPPRGGARTQSSGGRPNSRTAYLALLGFGPDAEPSEDELKKAYRKMAMRWHPDRPQNRDCAAEATEKFQKAKEAYDYFMEEHRKANG